MASTVPTSQNYGTLPIGTVLDGYGPIERRSLTAYLAGGQWVPFSAVHPEEPVMPLVTFGAA